MAVKFSTSCKQFLRLGVLLIFCCDVVSSDGSFDIEINYGKCDGNALNAKGALFPMRAVLVVVSKDGNYKNMIEEVYSFMFYKDDAVETPENLQYKQQWDNITYSLKANQEARLVLYVTATGKMNYMDVPIYYGYDERLVGPLVGSNQKEEDTAFRIESLTLTYTQNGKKSTVVEAKTECSQMDPEGWIGNHGVYWLQKRSNGAPFFTNLYYWPKRNQIFT